MKRMLILCSVVAVALVTTNDGNAQNRPYASSSISYQARTHGVMPRRGARDSAPPVVALDERAPNRPFVAAPSPAVIPIDSRAPSNDVASPLQPAPVREWAPAQTQPVWKSYTPTKLFGGKRPHVCNASGCCAKRWCGTLGGVYMTRDSADDLWLSYDQNSIADRVLTSNDADFSWGSGAEARLRRYFNCGRNSLEFAYWGIYPDAEEANALGSDTVSGLDTILHFDTLSYDPGTGAELVSNFYFDAERHRVQREYQVHNVELNLLGHDYAVPCCGLRLGWTAGVRYLRIDEDFLYSGDRVDDVFDGNAEEIHYGIDVENNLIGFQVGGRADYCFWECLNAFADTKVGLFGNHIGHESSIYGANGAAFVSDAASPYFNQDLNIASSKNDVALVAELALGLDWQFHPCWNVGVGYRAVGVSGVAVATHQVPVDFIGALPSVEAVDSNCGLILHGGFLNVTYCH